MLGGMPGRRGGAGGRPRASSDAPRVFLSYRRADTGHLVTGLADHLRADLGSTNVFRDTDDLIAGTPWQDALDEAIRDCDAALFLVGRDWAGAREDGTRRIDDPDDPVAVEVRRALSSDAACTPVPVVVNLGQPPQDILPPVARLFDHHAVTTTDRDLVDGGPSDYQAILVGIWESVRRRTPNGVLIVGDDVASAQLDDLVQEMKQASLIDARHMSRLAAGACVVSARRIRRGARKWPDAIVVADSREPSRLLASRIRALDEHPGIRRVAAIGAGVAAGFAIGQVAGGASATTWTAATQVGPAVPAIGTGPVGAVSSTLAHTSRAARVGVSAVALGAATVAVAALPSGVAASAQYGYLDVAIDGPRVAADVPDDLVDEDVQRWAAADVTVENSLRLDERDVPADLFWLDTDRGRIPGQLEDRWGEFVVPADGSASATIWWPLPDGTTDWSIELREDGAEPLLLSGADARPAEVPIPVEGSYRGTCPGSQDPGYDGPGLTVEGGTASYNASPTPTGERAWAPGESELGRASEGSVIVTLDVTAEHDCSPLGWIDVYGDVYNHLAAAQVGDVVPDVEHNVPRQSGSTETGQVYVEVPEDATGTLTFDWEPEEVHGGVRVDLGPVADIANLDN